MCLALQIADSAYSRVILQQQTLQVNIFYYPVKGELKIVAYFPRLVYMLLSATSLSDSMAQKFKVRILLL